MLVITNDDYVKAVTPFKNGCDFICCFKQDGTVTIEPGCCLYVNLISGVKRILYEKWISNNKQAFEINISKETRTKILEIKPCARCGGTQFGI